MKAIYYKLEGKNQSRRLTLGKEYEYYECGTVIVQTDYRTVTFSKSDFKKYFIGIKGIRKIKLKKINERR